MSYIEKEPLIEFITKGLNNPDKTKAFGHDAIEILAEIEYAPTADVVPKSEVENIISDQRQRLNEYKKQIVTLQEKLEQAKADAAKEIFDELEREIEDALKNNYEALRRFEDSDDLWHNVNGKINTLRGLEHFIGELKKKFEGKYGGSQ